MDPVDRLDLLQYLADAQDGIGKTLRFLSKIPAGTDPMIDFLWNDATRLQRLGTDAMERVRRSPSNEQTAA
jgi:hypothetical protein